MIYDLASVPFTAHLLDDQPKGRDIPGKVFNADLRRFIMIFN